ncbi:hypothetical protein ACFS4T_21210 [Pseudomonas lini]
MTINLVMTPETSQLLKVAIDERYPDLKHLHRSVEITSKKIHGLELFDSTTQRVPAALSSTSHREEQTASRIFTSSKTGMTKSPHRNGFPSPLPASPRTGLRQFRRAYDREVNVSSQRKRPTKRRMDLHLGSRSRKSFNLFLGAFPTKDAAEARASTLGEGYKATYVTHLPGTDEFIIEDEPRG